MTRSRSVGLGCAALALVALAGVGALAIAVLGAPPRGPDLELLVEARTDAPSIDLAESDLCPRLERGVPPEHPTYSEVTETGCTVHVPLAAIEATGVAERVRAALATERFAEPPLIRRVGRGRDLWMVAEGAPRDAALALELLQREIESLSGVALAEICGPEPATSIRIDPSALTVRALPLDDVIEALSIEWPPGDRRDHAIEAITVAPGVALRDVATIVEVALPRSCTASLEGAPVAAMRVRLQSGASEREVMASLRAAVGTRARLVETDRAIAIAWAREVDLDRVSERARALVHRDADGIGVEASAPDVEDRLAAIPGIAIAHAGHDVARLWLPREADPAEVVRRVRDLALVVAPLARTPQSEITVTIDRARAERLGVPLEAVARTVAAWRGIELRDERGRRVQVRIDVPETAEAATRLLVTAPDGRAIPLSELATIAERAPAASRHRRRGAPALGLLVSSRERGVDPRAIARALEGLEVEIEPL